MRPAIVVAISAIALAFGVSALAASGGTDARGSQRAGLLQPGQYVANSTQAVCRLTGINGPYPEQPAAYTSTQYGIVAGDAGSSFEFDGQVWWLFGNSGASSESPWGMSNLTTRWPHVSGPLTDPVALGSDAIASSPDTDPPAPYTGTKMPPNQQCPVLTFIRKASGAAYANPSVSADPLSRADYLSLRTGELPEAGISEGDPAQMYVVFGTDNPANCATLSGFVGPCAEPTHKHKPARLCGKQAKGSRTRSVMAVYTGSGAAFTALYDLSTASAATRYEPECAITPQADAAKFVNVQMANGPGGYVYIWGTEGGANNGNSPIYLARIRAAKIATGAGLEYWDDDMSPPRFAAVSQAQATPLFNDTPNPCASQVGVQYNQYLQEWILLYHCTETPVPAGHPDGIYMRTAPSPSGPWSSPTTIFDPVPDSRTGSGYCYFIYSIQSHGYPSCPPGSPNATLPDTKKMHVGDYYGPYFVADWVTGVRATSKRLAQTTIYYTLDTFDPYGQLVLRSTIVRPAQAPVPPKPPKPTCKATACT